MTSYTVPNWDWVVYHVVPLPERVPQPDSFECRLGAYGSFETERPYEMPLTDEEWERWKAWALNLVDNPSR